MPPSRKASSMKAPNFAAVRKLPAVFIARTISTRSIRHCTIASPGGRSRSWRADMDSIPFTLTAMTSSPCTASRPISLAAPVTAAGRVSSWQTPSHTFELGARQSLLSEFKGHCGQGGPAVRPFSCCHRSGTCGGRGRAQGRSHRQAQSGLQGTVLVLTRWGATSPGGS